MSYTYNRWKSSTVFGNFQVSDTPDSSILANGTFDRNLTVKNDINIGQETATPILDAQGNVISTTYTSTGGNFNFTLNGVNYSIGKTQLIKLLNNLATESYVTTAVNNAITALINNSPTTLDTLQELANALGNDPNFATTITNNLATKGSLSGTNTWSGSNTFTTPIVMNNNSNYILSNTSAWTSLTGVQNCMIGYLAGTALTSGSQNIYIGPYSGQSSTTSTRNVCIGESTGATLTTSDANTFIGSWAGQYTTTGRLNTYLGMASGREGTTAGNMVCIGYSAGRLNLTGGNSVIIGTQAGYNNTINNNNTIIGYNANYNATTGNTSVYIGYSCASYQEGNNNCAIGVNAYQGVSGGTNTGTGNSCIGRNALNTLSSGINNSAIGYASGRNATTNTYNTFLGYNSGIDVSGNTWTASTAVGQNALITASNQIILGGLNSTTYPSVYIPSGKLGVGMYPPVYNVDVTGNINATTGLFVNGTNINTVYQPISGMSSYGSLSGANAWTGTNTFNTNLPTSTLTPTLGTQLITKTFSDATYQTISGMSSYLTTATASTTYQPISGMSSYGSLSGTNAWSGTNTFNTSLPTSTLTPTLGSQLITKTFGDATYQAISGMSSYLTTANASSTYQPISGMSSYLTTANASTTYGALSGTNAWSGTNTFNTNLPTSTLTPTLANQFITKTYADSTYTTAGNIIGANNAWTGTNTFNTSLPTSTLTPTLGTQLITKTFGDATYQSISGMSSYLTTATASTTYAPLASPTFTGTITAPIINASGLITANAGLTIPTAQVLTLTGNVSANATTITPTVLSYISTLSSNAQTQINAKAPTASPTFTGTITAPIINASGLVTANAGLTIPNNQFLNLVGKINANSINITPAELGCLNNISSNIQTQLDSKAPLANPTFTGTITAPIINASGLITANAGLTIPTTQTLNLVGNISANTTTISPTELSYLDNVSSNIQTQLDSKGGLTTQNTWTTLNTFNRIAISSNNIAGTGGTYSRTANLDNQSGCHIQWTRDGGDGSTYIMNQKGGATGNGDFIFQRYNGSGVFYDEPFVISDTIYMNKPIQATNNFTTLGTITAPSATIDTVNGKYLVTKDITAGSSKQSVIYQNDSTVYYAGQTNNTNHNFACLDSTGNQKISLSMNYSNSTFYNELNPYAGIYSSSLRQYSLTNSNITSSFPSNQYVLGIVPSYIAAVRTYVVKVGEITVPRSTSVDITISTPFAYFGETGNLTGFTDTRNFTSGLIIIGLDNTSVLTTITPTFTDSIATNARQYTYPTTGVITQKLYKQYISNVVGTFTTNFDTTASHTYQIYVSTTNAMDGVEFNTTQSGLQLINCTTSSVTGSFYSAGNYSKVNKILSSITQGVTEVYDLQCTSINGITPYLNKCAYATIKYNGSSYFIAGGTGNIAISFTSPNLLVRLTNTTTSGLSYSPQNTFFNVQVSGTQNNDGVLGNSLNFQVFSKGTYSVSGLNYYGFLLTWCKINTSVFATLGTNTGTIDVMITW